MIYTLGYARTKYAKFVDSGSCKDNAVVVERINDAVRQILMIQDWHLTIQRMRFTTTKNFLVLPHFAEKIVACRFNSDDCNRKGEIFSQSYEFMENGPLTLENGVGGVSSLVDLGDGHSTMFEIDRASTWRIACFSTIGTDGGKILKIKGKTTGGEDLGGGFGINLPINVWLQGEEGHIDSASLIKSDVDVLSISSIKKAVTTGYVTLIAFDTEHTDNSIINVLSKYHPLETDPGYRKYKILDYCGSDSASIPALVKMRFVPVSDDDDPLLVQNPDAIKAMLQSMGAKDSGDIARGMQYATECLWLLGQQLNNSQPSNNEIQVESQFSLGGIGQV